MGRRTTFNAKDAQTIVSRLATGEPMAVICRTEGLPTDRTVRNWMDANAEFASFIAHARELGFDAIAHDALTIADDIEGDPQRDRLRVDTRLKLLAKWDPKRYGDKIDVNHTGEVTNRHDLSGHSADELATLERLVEKASDASGDTGRTGQKGPDRVH